MGARGMLGRAGRTRGAPVHAGVRICVDCGSARIAITEGAVRCRECGSEHRRRVPGLRLRPGDRVRVPGRGGEAYVIERITQDSAGAARYVLRSGQSPISLLHEEGPGNMLERA